MRGVLGAPDSPNLSRERMKRAGVGRTRRHIVGPLTALTGEFPCGNETCLHTLGREKLVHFELTKPSRNWPPCCEDGKSQKMAPERCIAGGRGS